MSIVVNTNIGSLNAQRSLAESSRELATAMERLSSGKKINSAADDAAGFAIAERMTAQVRGLNVATKNANDGLAMLATIENATNDVTDMLQRVRELAVQASNDTNSSTDRGYLQKEVDSLLNEINRVASQTVYNNKVVLDGSLSGQLQVGTDMGQNISFAIKSIDTDTLGLTGSAAVAAVDTFAYAALDSAIEGITAGAKTVDFAFAGSTLSFAIEDSGNTAGKISKTADINTVVADIKNHGSYASANFTVASDGTDLVFTAKSVGENTTRATYTVTGASAVNATQTTAGVADTWFDDGTTTATLESISVLDISTQIGASYSIATIDGALETVSGIRGSLGTLQNRLAYSVSNLMKVTEYTIGARSRIQDADFAAETARLAKAQVLQQAGASMLSQANASTDVVLQVLRG